MIHRRVETKGGKGLREGGTERKMKIRGDIYHQCHFVSQDEYVVSNIETMQFRILIYSVADTRTISWPIDFFP